MEVHTSTSPLKRYLVGFTLAVILTAAPFALVLSEALPRALALNTIAVAAVLQILVHLRYFLDLRLSPDNPWYLVAIVFTAIILCIMVAGSLWILLDLNRHMMT
jgi:cytochrome o ubiquinol oxidase subunit IV